MHRSSPQIYSLLTPSSITSASEIAAYEDDVLALDTVHMLPHCDRNRLGHVVHHLNERDPVKTTRNSFAKIAERVLRISEPKRARLTGSTGRFGSQLPMREVFNKL